MLRGIPTCVWSEVTTLTVCATGDIWRRDDVVGRRHACTTGRRQDVVAVPVTS
jgi:pSer/pThr/pTyr-binding forkhead associated (FHA) protein